MLFNKFAYFSLYYELFYGILMVAKLFIPQTLPKAKGGDHTIISLTASIEAFRISRLVSMAWR